MHKIWRSRFMLVISLSQKPKITLQKMTGVVTYRSAFIRYQQLTVQDGGCSVKQLKPKLRGQADPSLPIILKISRPTRQKWNARRIRWWAIANSLIHEIHNPDIITLIEVQDNNGSVDDSGTTSGVKVDATSLVGSRNCAMSICRRLPTRDGADAESPALISALGILYNPRNRVTQPRKRQSD